MQTLTSTTGGIDTVRQANMNSLSKDIGLDSLDGFQLPSDVTEEFLLRMQESVEILGMVDTMTLARLEQEVPKFGVPILSGAQRDEEGNRTSASDADSGHVKFNATDKQYYILVEPERDALKNTRPGVDNFGQLIVDEFTARWANDVGLIGIRANCADADLQTSFDEVADSTLDDTWNGWIAIAEGQDTDSDRIGLEDTSDVDEMPSVDANDESLDTETFNDTIHTLPQRYRDPDSVAFVTSPDQVQQYAFDLTQREDPLGSAVIFGDSDLTPFDYDVVGINGWPNDYMMLTDMNNLAFGLYEEMELDQTTDTDKVHEERLHSRNWLEGQFDYQIKELQAGVLVENLADPVA